MSPLTSLSVGGCCNIQLLEEDEQIGDAQVQAKVHDELQDLNHFDLDALHSLVAGLTPQGLAFGCISVICVHGFTQDGGEGREGRLEDGTVHPTGTKCTTGACVSVTKYGRGGAVRGAYQIKHIIITIVCMKCTWHSKAVNFSSS